jgi:hypothetical protein
MRTPDTADLTIVLADYRRVRGARGSGFEYSM